MDLDLATVRAFVRTAEELHFGRAAAALGLSQQAVSKRVARLESTLGVRLLERDHHGVRLTADGRRFLPGARETLAAAERAITGLVDAHGPLRIDVWGHQYDPLRTLAQVATAPDAPALQPGHGRDLPAVAGALLRGDIDAGFGRVHPPLPAGLTHRLIRLEPVDVVLGDDHPFAGATALRPDQLRGSVLYTPATLDRLDFLTRFSEHFGISEHRAGPNLGLALLLSTLRTDPRGIALLPADVEFPDLTGIHTVPLVDPTPLYAWSLIWRTRPEPPLLEPLLTALVYTAGQRRWLEFDPAGDWLPTIE
ncbi:LysR family transcriptional regulator [Nocardia mangyaensis]|uniref:LysR family transcriptional regulator n=1 Tax=Nocardia mangyaensis TaxID=2213200 RepID=UPI002676BA7E|nr:LysR family transcriptional regulator [Nocardia mangyaensis]MDO3650630.1 LysR family transcriptional regulator [Nocardia mangyaensis]